MHTNDSTSLTLPPPVAVYFMADTTAADVVAHCFAENGVVIDEQREHLGRSNIARWIAETVAKYHYTSEPLAAEARGQELIVTARVTGPFPGSPVDLRYCFTLEGDVITRLEIAA